MKSESPHLLTELRASRLGVGVAWAVAKRVAMIEKSWNRILMDVCAGRGMKG
jgi:hypothetical protein